MAPLPSLLLTAAWLAPVFALPHSEAVSTSMLVARTIDPDHLPNLPTLAPASWCQEVPFGKGDVVWHEATGPCTYNTLRGEVTLVNGGWEKIPETDVAIPMGEKRPRPTGSGTPDSGTPGSGVSGPGPDGVVETPDGRCFIVREKMTKADGATEWVDVGQNTQQACNDYCVTQLTTSKEESEIGSATCFKNNGKPWVDNSGNQPSDESPVGTRIQGVGECMCNWPLLNELVEDMVTKALPAVGELTCKTFYTAINSVVSVGLNAIPSISAVGAAGVTVAAQVAEVMTWTFSDPNAALQHYGDWLQHPAGGDLQPAEDYENPSTGLMDTVCGNKYANEDSEKIFNAFQLAANFASAPKLFAGAAKSWPPPFEQGKGSIDDARDYIKGLEKGKGDADRKPEPTQPKPTDKPSSTTPHESTNTSQNDKCKRDGDCGVTSYIVKEMITAKETVIPMTCDHERYPQACAGYYSAISGRGIASDKYTCSESHHNDGRIHGKATDEWTAQHTNREWQSFTSLQIIDNKGERRDTRCQADEFPPDYFLDQDKTMTQLVRWIPDFDNGGAANKLWTGFCNKYDGNKGNGQRTGPKSKDKKPIPEDERPLNDKLLKLEGLEVKSNQGTTTSIWQKATYSPAVFSMAFKYKPDEAPSEGNNWHLEENACWPKDITPEDPGYVLLTTDQWYKEDHKDFPNAGSWRDRYASDPSEDEKAAAIERQKGNKRGPPGSPDEQPDKKKIETSPPNERRGAGLEKLELYEGRLIARNLETNVTRPLTNQELRQQVEVVPCKDKHCSGELRGGDNDLLVPGVAPPSAPAVNHDAMPTFTPTQRMRTEIRPQRRTDVYPDLPVVTDLAKPAIVLEA